MCFTITQEALHSMLQSVDQLKQSFCRFSLSTVDPSVEDPLVLGLATFCTTNDTFLEISLIILNKVRPYSPAFLKVELLELTEILLHE